VLESGVMLVLASNSPRRKQLLSLGGWDFTVFPAHVDESVLPGESPSEYVRRLAESKAWAVLGQGKFSADTLVVAADTTVVDGRTILGKPRDAQEAETMLKSLRGRSHQVLTGLALLSAAERELVGDLCASEVFMRAYSDEEIEEYIASGDPFDKAGAYAIQHPGFKPAERLQGCYANVMGLPVCHLSALLATFGVYPMNDLVQNCQQVLDAPCQVFERVYSTHPGSGGAL
jgi:septum formation protein